MQTKLLTKLLQEMGPGVLPVTLKQSNRVLNALVRITLVEGTEIPKVPHQGHVDIFFNSQGEMQKELVPEEKTVNTESYNVITDRLLKRIRLHHPAAFCSRVFFLQYDIAPADKAATVCQFLTQTILYRPPYPVDLSPPDYFLFPKLKLKLKGLHFADVAGSKKP